MYLMSVQTMIGDFVQVGPDGRRVEGKVYLQKPGRIRFEYNPPSPIELSPTAIRW
jgi:outer membrane lipoprotein-sorting protein